MKLKCCATQVEIYDEDTADHIATVKAFDESTAELEFNSLFSRDSCDDILAAIKEAVMIVTEPIKPEDVE